ncbi:MAG: class I SAM-dependent methyltransferase [Chloroflexi bacterium]|nr:class I SAM-dependent methyltransferase [Chloroflexota bacterium]
MTMRRDPEGLETRTLLEYVDFAGRRVLEIGCGEGRLTARLAPHVAALVGIDLDPDRLCEARTALAGRPNVSLAGADTLALPFPAGAFDVALLAWSL